jgi:hypothetical protein
MFSTPEFIQAIKQWALRFSQNLTRMGLNPLYFGYTEQVQPAVAPLDDLFHPYQVIQYLEINSTNDGSIEIVGSKDFWNSFCIQLTPYGASLLGIDLDQLQNHDGRYFLASNDDSFSTPFLDLDIGSGQYRFEVGGNTTERTFQTITPIYQSCDQRVKISVTSGLNILSNVKIVNGLQTTDRTIAEAFFENRLTSEITRAGTTFETKLTSKIYAGQMSMIRKSDQYHSWTKLLNSFDTKFFRFYIWVTYRIFNDATNKWAIQTKLLDVDDNDYWLFQIRFVSDV